MDSGTRGAAAAPDGGRWLFLHRPDPRARVRLFCLPFAGGGASAYRGWGDRLPPEVEVCPVQLPGRENRADEPPATGLGALAGTLAEVLRPYLDLPFALFGHSMGALLAFELARALRGEGAAPAHLFVSACPAPPLPLHGAPMHRLPDGELARRLRRLGGVPREILRDPEWLEVLLPLLRADFQMVETYRPAAGPPLACPVTALGGWWDPRVRGRQLRAWGRHTRGPFAVRRFPGGHFYLQRSRGPLLRAVLGELGDLPRGRGAPLVSAYTTFS